MHFQTPELLADPYPFYRVWRENQPIWRDEGTGYHVLTRHDDVRAILRNSADFSSSAMSDSGTPPLPLLADDPPRHTHLRGIVNKAFTARALRLLETGVDAIAKRLVDDLPVDMPVDIVTRLTTPLPVAVIARMMAIPESRADDFKRWSDALTGTLAGHDPSARQQDIMEMATFFAELIPARRTNPGTDLVSDIVNASVDGEGLADGDIVGFCILLLIAGNETTTNLLGNLLNVLVDRPDLYDRLREDPDLIEPAIEEALRYDAPVQFLMRKATRSTALHGKTIEAGDGVIVVMGSANRDESVYPAADEFRLDRERINHHAFGFGIHFCIGAPLARLEAKLAMRTLTTRFTRLARGPDTDVRTASHLLRGFHHLSLECG